LESDIVTAPTYEAKILWNLGSAVSASALLEELPPGTLCKQNGLTADPRFQRIFGS